jgi:hypothetical protein
MEIVFAIVVVSAVIFFGALLSLGNERQRRAIDELREQIVLWALQDLRLKREHLAREVRVEDPLGWFNRLATKAHGANVDLQLVESFDDPRAVVCVASDGHRLIFSPLSPADLRALRRMRKGKLGQYANGNPLLSLPRNVDSHEFSSLNGGLLFDLELPLAWMGLTGREGVQLDRLWMYVVE